MTRPTWVTVVGILGIIFGCTGILGGGQQLLMPKMLAFQKAMMTDMDADFARSGKSSGCHNDSAAARNSDSTIDSSGAQAVPVQPCHAAHMPPEMPAAFKEMWNLPPWAVTWLVVGGGLRLLVAAFYLFSAIWFIQLKPSAILLFSAALSLSIALGLGQFVMAFFAGSFMIAAMMAGSSIGIVIDVVLLLVIWLSDRSVFRPRPETIEPAPIAP